MKGSIALFFALSLMLPVAAHAAWGVIAVDDRVGERDPAYGVGGGRTQAEATKIALKFCKEASGIKCEIAVRYEKCGAYASSRKYSGAGIASNEHDARRRALGECNDASCRILVADCN